VSGARPFAEIEAVARQRKGGREALEALLKSPRDTQELSALPLSVWLEAMAKAIFQAGFNWSVIEAKWSGFQAAFEGFDPHALAFQPDEAAERLLGDKRVVRNAAKIMAVFENARFLSALQAETGDAVGHLARWPVEDHAELLTLFASRGARLGGLTGQRACRAVGRDGFVLSPDVVKRLALEGVLEGPATSKTALAKAQAAFNRWRAESGRPLTQISQILAFSVD
jgi:3-methyladenine DNA glycosylase Tag